jgi:hypothetical protein
MVWPRGHLAAGSFWHYQPTQTVSIDTVRERVLIQHNAMVAGRGGLVCPVGCDCTTTSSCGVPYVQTPPPTPHPPTPPPPPTPPTPPPTPHPTPPAPAPSSECTFITNTALDGGQMLSVPGVRTKEACCGLCRAHRQQTTGSVGAPDGVAALTLTCKAAAYHADTSICVIRSVFKPKPDPTGTLTCQPKFYPVPSPPPTSVPPTPTLGF